MATLLAGKRCLITGASSGIGFATAKVFIAEGAIVSVTGRNEAALRAIEGAAHVHAVDITTPGGCAAVVQSSVAKMGGLDCVVNCAGVLKGAAIQDTTLETWDFNFNINTRAVFEIMQHSIPHLKESGKSCIVNVSSVNGLQSFAGTAAYCASKAAVDQLTRCAAVDLAPFGIRVNAVNPGVVITELQKRGGLDDTKYAAFLERSSTVTHPLGRVGEPEEVGNLIAFLASNKASFITGDCIAIDGGRACLGAR